LFYKKVALPNIAVAKTSWWKKRYLALKSWWHKCRFLVIGGTNVIFLGIGGTKVDLVEGGKNVVVAVAKTSWWRWRKRCKEQMSVGKKLQHPFHSLILKKTLQI
jgi:hypothetical protein